MRKLLIAFACLAVGAGIRAESPVVNQLPGAPIGEPLLEFDELEHDFGKIGDQHEISHRFVFSNAGTAPLIFPPEQRSTGHGGPRPHSLATNEQQFVFAPGERGYFELRMNPRGRRGELVNRLTVLSNDPRYGHIVAPPDAPNRSASLVIPPPVVNAKPRIEFETLEHDFGTVSDQDDLKFRFIFRNTGSGSLIFKSQGKEAHSGTGFRQPQSLSGLSQLEFAPGEQGYIEVWVNPRGKGGCIEQRLRVHTNDPRYK